MFGKMYRKVNYFDSYFGISFLKMSDTHTPYIDVCLFGKWYRLRNTKPKRFESLNIPKGL